MICDGDGICLTQSGEEEYEKNNEIECAHNCVPVQCPNAEYCGKIAPAWYFNCHGGQCMNCNVLFGTWNGGRGKPRIGKIADCPICMESDKVGITYPKCDHMICVRCFNRCFDGQDFSFSEPKFPYDDIVEEAYHNDVNRYTDPTWDEQYPLIREYNEMWDEWDRMREQARNNETHLRQCAICRK